MDKFFVRFENGLANISITAAEPPDDEAFIELPFEMSLHPINRLYLKDDVVKVITEPMPNDGAIYYFDLDDEIWIYDISNEKQKKSAEIDAICSSEIYAGFTSEALGEMHHYPANDKDQANLTASILDSLLDDNAEWITPFWCKNQDGEWGFRMHTRTQIQQVGKTAKQKILEKMAKNEFLQTLIIQATTRSQLEAISWDE